ncbi:MAG TPA: PEP-CTERM sorting domain-containing protein [Phycisphaerae bacterium]|nr:PEP-CTERM sorting domain-containing protein [Phycisphaerae bacterium]HRY71305.1 PEP-CTERM sorting domain-containing protein [Phycisphaerae bacterium]HSA29693.1 PEP-CTERM sorting domain-containing protein [Phycisphaerae bacterium]
MRFSGFAVLAASMVGLFLSPAGGTEILWNNVVLVSDNFDTTAGGGNDTLGAQPLADVGAWISNDTTVNNVVTNASAPGAQQGDAYLRLAHDGTATGAAQLKANFAPITTAGDTFTWRSRVYFTGGGHDDDYQFSARTTGTGGFPDDYVFLTTIRGGVVNAYDGSGYVPTSTKILPDRWTTWEISYTRGANTFSWLVNGVGDTAAPAMPGAADRDIGFAMFWGNYTSSQDGGFPVYLDAVPEPASIVLLVLGGLGLLVTRRGT